MCSALSSMLKRMSPVGLISRPIVSGHKGGAGAALLQSESVHHRSVCTAKKEHHTEGTEVTEVSWCTKFGGNPRGQPFTYDFKIERPDRTTARPLLWKRGTGQIS